MINATERASINKQRVAQIRTSCFVSLLKAFLEVMRQYYSTFRVHFLSY